MADQLLSALSQKQRNQLASAVGDSWPSLIDNLRLKNEDEMMTISQAKNPAESLLDLLAQRQPCPTMAELRNMLKKGHCIAASKYIAKVIQDFEETQPLDLSKKLKMDHTDPIDLRTHQNISSHGRSYQSSNDTGYVSHSTTTTDRHSYPQPYPQNDRRNVRSIGRKHTSHSSSGEENCISADDCYLTMGSSIGISIGSNIGSSICSNYGSLNSMPQHCPPGQTNMSTDSGIFSIGSSTGSNYGSLNSMPKHCPPGQTTIEPFGSYKQSSSTHQYSNGTTSSMDNRRSIEPHTHFQSQTDTQYTELKPVQMTTVQESIEEDDRPPPLVRIDCIKSRKGESGFYSEGNSWREPCPSPSVASDGSSRAFTPQLTSDGESRTVTPHQQFSSTHHSPNQTNLDLTSLNRSLENIEMTDQTPSTQSHSHSGLQSQHYMEQGPTVKQQSSGESARETQQDRGSEPSHREVLNRLRDRLIKKDTVKYQEAGRTSNEESMDTDDQITNCALIPTVVEQTDNEGGATDVIGAGYGMVEFKSSTYPRVNKKEKKPEMMKDCAKSSNGLLETVEYKATPSKVKVFLTLGLGRNKAEFEVTRKQVLHLVQVLIANDFDPAMDTYDMEKKHQVLQRFKEADFVLVCISPAYNEEIRSQSLQRPPKKANNARTLYKLMQKEFKANNYQNNRFIPVLLEETNMTHVPEWFQKICPKETFYAFPTKIRNLVYHLSRPHKVIKRFVDKHKLAVSMPYTPNIEQSTIAKRTPVMPSM